MLYIIYILCPYFISFYIHLSTYNLNYLRRRRYFCLLCQMSLYYFLVTESVQFIENTFCFFLIHCSVVVYICTLSWRGTRLRRLFPFLFIAWHCTACHRNSSSFDLFLIVVTLISKKTSILPTLYYHLLYTKNVMAKTHVLFSKKINKNTLWGWFSNISI